MPHENERTNNLGIDRQEKSDSKTKLTTPIYEIELFSVHFDMKFWCVKIALFAPISYSCQFSRLTAKIDALKLQLLSTDKLVWLSAMCPTFVRPSVHPYVTKGQLLKWIIWVWMTFFSNTLFRLHSNALKHVLKIADIHF